MLRTLARSLPLALLFALAACSGSASGDLSGDADVSEAARRAHDAGDAAPSTPPPPDADAAAPTPPPPSPADGGADASAPDASDAAATPLPNDAAPPPSGMWLPTSDVPMHFHWQLQPPFAYPADVLAGQGTIVYDIDGETNDAATVAKLHALGPNVKVVCYVDVGTWEDYRSDAAQFPASVIGNPNGWPGEKWLDARAQSTLLPIMKARFQNWCAAKGFDAIEPDNLDAWTNNPGFPITESDNLAYDVAIAQLAHSLGLSVALKNLPDKAATLEPNFDFAVTEECFQYGECAGVEQGFAAKGKAVFEVEYASAPDCASANAAHMNAEQRDKSLVAPGASGFLYKPCVDDGKATW